MSDEPSGQPPYRPDFYIFDNIVGYTGDLHTDPTVYFETDTEWGHITQAHPRSDNVGRETVRLRQWIRCKDVRGEPDYMIIGKYEYDANNILINGRPTLVEGFMDPGGDRFDLHVSRNKREQPLDDEQKAILAQAIANKQFKKLRDSFAGKLFPDPDNNYAVYFPKGP